MTAPLRDRRGFALPLVILLVAVLTVLLITGLSRARAERQIAEASDATASAIAVAESGLQTYFGTTTVKPADGDSTRINVTGGYANVIVHLVRQPADTTMRSLYLVRSTGVAISPAAGAMLQAVHTIAQFAEWEAGYMLHPATLLAANGIQKKNGAATLLVYGADLCAVRPPVPGVYTTIVTGPPNPVPDFQGNPGLIEAGASQGVVVAGLTLIDWAGALGGELTPDYTSFQQGDFSYPIQRTLGDLTISGTKFGSGLLVVQGDLTISGSFFYFEGIILVGGKIEFGASFQQVRGVVMSGLNEQLGINPQKTEMGGAGNNLYLYYDSCKIQSALAPLTGLAPVRNAWIDTWASY